MFKCNLIKALQRFVNTTLVALCLASAPTWAASLTNIDFKALSNGQAQIKLDFDAAPPQSSVYAVESPPRLIFDLKNTDSQLNKKSFNFDHPNVKSALAVAAGGRVRFVIDMRELEKHVSNVNNNSLLITIGDQQQASKQASAQRRVTPPAPRDSIVPDSSLNVADASNSVPANAINGSDARSSNDADASMEVVYNSVKSVEFQRTAIGAGEVHITLANPRFEAESKRAGNSVNVKIPKASLTKGVQRVSNLTQFGTIVKSINNQANADAVNIKINAGDDFDYEAYQIDNKYVVSMSPKRARQPTSRLNPRRTAPNTGNGMDEYTGERLSLNFQNIEIRSVLQLIADFTNLNLVVSDSVEGNITLRLKNVPWDQALAIILKAKGLDKRREGNVLMVAPTEEISERERKELEASKQLEALAPLMTEHIKIKYADATEVFNLFLNTNSNGSSSRTRQSNSNSNNDQGTRGDDSIAESTASLLSPRGSVVVDERTNSLFVTETQERLQNLRQLIDKIDIPIRQVMIEARIVVANKSATKDIGVRWGATQTRGNLSVGGALGNSLSAVGGPLATNPAAMITNFDVSSATSGLNIGFAAGGFDVINLQLLALEESGNGEVISRPKVITGDKQEAVIESGTEVPFTTQGQDGVVTTEFKDVVLKLGVTPYITPDGRVIMDLDIVQDSVGELINVVSSGSTGSSQIPRIDTTKLNTQVLAGDGETVVLGGVFQENNTETNRKTPLLGDLPIVGSLFKAKTQQVDKVETLIFITPKIIDETLID